MICFAYKAYVKHFISTCTTINFNITATNFNNPNLGQVVIFWVMNNKLATGGPPGFYLKFTIDILTLMIKKIKGILCF